MGNMTAEQRENLLADMSAHDVQEYMHNYGFTLEEIAAELDRRVVVEAEDIAETVSPERPTVASDTTPEATYTLALNGKTVDIAGAHGIAESAALELLRAGLGNLDTTEIVQEIVQGATSGEHPVTTVSTGSSSRVLIFHTTTTEN